MYSEKVKYDRGIVKLSSISVGSADSAAQKNVYDLIGKAWLCTAKACFSYKMVDVLLS